MCSLHSRQVYCKLFELYQMLSMAKPTLFDIHLTAGEVLVPELVGLRLELMETRIAAETLSVEVRLILYAKLGEKAH